MNSNDWQDLLDLIPAYSIGATDDDETRRVEAGLAQNPRLAAELAAYQQFDAHLLMAVPQVAAPPELFGNLLSAARPQRPARRFTMHWQWVAAAACLLLFIAVNNVYWLSRLQEVEGRALSTYVLNLPTAANGEQTGAIAQVRWLPGAENCLLLVSNFPTESGGSFQAWVTHNGTITSLGTFSVDERGEGSLLFSIEYMYGGKYEAIGVTLEPLGGSSQPTTAPVVRWASKKA